MKRVAVLLLCGTLWACGGRSVIDAGRPDSGDADAGEDAGESDAGLDDGGLDGGDDAGLDGGDDAGLDAGEQDAGEDAGFDAGEPDAGPYLRCYARDSGIPDGGLLRVVAGNLSSGNLQSYDPGEGARIFRGLKPDVVLIQEWNIGDKTDLARRTWVNATFGEEFCFQVEDGKAIPNGVISRYPILDAGSWSDPTVSNRSFVWAQIDVPGNRDLWAVSLHWLTSSTGHNAEGTELVAKINQFIPPGDLLVLGGDLNTGSRNDTGVTVLSQVVRTAGPYPVDSNNNQNTNTNRNSPYDWVLADPDLAALQVPVTIGDAGFDAGLVFDSRVYTPLSDVAPVQQTDSSVFGMQHMAVVKDFLLP